ncbi:hypothetical protein L7F22_017167 [Adiantum nelumboides]|nr:hypothetical protein [Adiantum nelumboides]
MAPKRTRFGGSHDHKSGTSITNGKGKASIVEQAPADSQSSHEKIIEVPLCFSLYHSSREELLLKQAQPPNLKGDGANVEQDAEVWLEAMDDYFEAAGTHPWNQTMLSMFGLTRDTKIWWKQHCQDSDIVGTSQSSEEIKDDVTAHYLPPTYRATKMNEFLSFRQLSSTLEEYYFKFVTLQRYAPKVTLEQQVVRICQGLIEPLNNKLETLRPTTLQDALLRAKPLAKEIKETTQGLQDYPSRRARLDNWNSGPANQAYQSTLVVATTTTTIEFPNVRCFKCQQYGHYRNSYPRTTRASSANAIPVNANERGQPNVRGGRRRGNMNQGCEAYTRGNAAIGQPILGDEADERGALHAASNNCQ